MCTETFLHLPEEKRKRILDAAWEEFTSVPFAGASINQIIRRAGIPRGSFYQYFADKGDLFNCLMEDVREEMRKFAGTYLAESHGDVFRATLSAYDRLLDWWDSGSVPLLNRIVQVMRINPGIDLETMITGNPEDMMSEELMKQIDLPRLRRRDGEFVKTMCCLTGMCLGGAWMGSLSAPSRRQEHRRRLMESLDIIRRGSLTEDALREGGAWE